MVAPVIKWAGGKRQLLPEIRARLPRDAAGGDVTYHEPFLGGGAVLFDLQPARARVADVNVEIINLLTVIRDDVDALVGALRGHEAANGPDHFYEVRAWDRDPACFAERPAVEKAARMLYLNKTCYNGLYRVNRAGQFNAPYGRYAKPNIVNEAGLRDVHAYLRGADVDLAVRGFAESCTAAEPGDVVYLDPPYDVVSDTANFTGYARDGFGRAEQEALKAACDDLDARGVRFLLSNSATPFIRGLYADYRVDVVRASRAINSNAARRGKVDEVLVRNY
ncbi:DNA adenine methylase [Corynebacterium sp. 335C]